MSSTKLNMHPKSETPSKCTSPNKDPQAMQQMDDQRSPPPLSREDDGDSAREPPSEDFFSEQAPILTLSISEQAPILTLSKIVTAQEIKEPKQATRKPGVHSLIQLFLAAAFIFVGSFAYTTHVQLKVLQKDHAKLDSLTIAYKDAVEKTKAIEDELHDAGEELDSVYLRLDTAEKHVKELREELDEVKAGANDEDEVNFLYSELERAQKMSNQLREELDDAKASANDEDEVKFLYSELERAQKISNELREESADEDEVKFLYSELDRAQKISNEQREE